MKVRDLKEDRSLSSMSRLEVCALVADPGGFLSITSTSVCARCIAAFRVAQSTIFTRTGEYPDSTCMVCVSCPGSWRNHARIRTGA